MKTRVIQRQAGPQLIATVDKKHVCLGTYANPAMAEQGRAAFDQTMRVAAEAPARPERKGDQP